MQDNLANHCYFRSQIRKGEKVNQTLASGVILVIHTFNLVIYTFNLDIIVHEDKRKGLQDVGFEVK